MDSSGPHRVKGDSGSRPNSLASVEGGQVSHTPSIREQDQATGGAIDILQQIAQALQKAAQPATVVAISHRENGKISTHRFSWEER